MEKVARSPPERIFTNIPLKRETTECGKVMARAGKWKTRVCLFGRK